MNYQLIYDSLVAKRLQEPAVGYTERHHILPKSLGGSDDPSNLVVLTGREHWVAHLLLHKIHQKPQTAYACRMMGMGSESRGISYVKNSRLYQSIKEECAKQTSMINSISQKGTGNSQFGKMWICNIHRKVNASIKKSDLIPDGWIKGRNLWMKKPKSSRIRRNNPLRITNGIKNTTLFWEDQTIPEGWYIGMNQISRQKLQQSMQGKNLGHTRNTGKKNPQYGLKYKWINNGEKNKKLFNEDDIPPGYKLGFLTRRGRYVEVDN